MLYNVRIEDALYNLNNTILKMGNYDVVDIMSIYDFFGRERVYSYLRKSCCA